ncbi:MAG: hypothetical protein IJO16_02450 [Clostridia bacterium]|nr:hypothetical protein [Clostridia bacterium]
MKRFIAFMMMFCMLFALTGCREKEQYTTAAPAKPVIYLYPEEVTDVSVSLDFNGRLTSTYPHYDGEWNVTAYPDGTLIDENGREYYCLFWEGVQDVEYDFSRGFCVKGEDTAEFLEKTLSEIGLTDKEANEFIIYWLPKMEVNEYNLISFQNEIYTDNAKLTISPEPDSLLRVFMAWKPVNEPVEIAPRTFEPFAREGFTAVEWGGSEIK